MIEVRTLQNMDDFKRIPAIEQKAWGFRDLEVEPHYLMTRAQKYGGLVQGLFLDESCIGFSFALPGRWRSEYFIYSHMTAVLPEYQGRGYGFILKKAQRRAVLDLGYTVMRWNFDPLESLNGFFNVHRLGVACEEYERDIYGKGESGLHEGMETDRLIACWRLDSPRVKEKLAERTPPLIEDVPEEHVDSVAGSIAYIEIPPDIRGLKREDYREAKRWRRRTRQAFERAFGSGFSVCDFLWSTDRQRVFYKLQRESSHG